MAFCLAAINNISSLAFSADGKWLTAGSQAFAQTIPVWQVATGKRVYELEGHQEGAGAVAFSPDSKIVASGGLDHTIRFWDLASGKELPRPAGHQGAVSAIAFSANGQMIVTGGRDKTIQVWEAATGVRRRMLAAHRDQGDVVCLSEDGKQAFVSGMNGVIRMRDVETDKELANFGKSDAGHRFLSMTNSGNLLASGSWSDPLTVWNINPQRLLWSVDKGPRDLISSLALSSDGMLVAAGMEREMSTGYSATRIVLRDVGTGSVRHRFGGHDARVVAVVFSPDNKTLASGTSDIRLWELLAGKERCRIAAATLCLAISPNGKILASGGDNNIVHLWELASGRELGRFAGHQDLIQSLRFSPDGKRLASGSRDSTVLIWDVVTLLAQVAPRQLTLSTKETAELWNDLSDSDAPRAYRAIGILSSAPAETVPLLRQRLQPATEKETQPLKTFIADLNSDEFNTRDRAMDGLSRLGVTAWPALRAALANKPSPEARQRIEQLLASRVQAPSPEVLRISRAIEILEQIGTAAADSLLSALARGSPEAWATQEARAAHERLNKR